MEEQVNEEVDVLRGAARRVHQKGWRREARPARARRLYNQLEIKTMTKTQADALSNKLESVVKELDAAIEKAGSNYEKTALKTYKGTVARVARDLKEMGSEKAA